MAKRRRKWLPKPKEVILTIYFVIGSTAIKF
ncbi:Uncharacterised protein [Streptococcus acidominimus]|uniref:Uncharacterized protein n=1 Tax=Streptococcus acidominimus TaxID=1326 RepID=A0A380IDU6_STRAI|nr:Uncharacterised protein [Streptococcus acidominimus]